MVATNDSREVVRNFAAGHGLSRAVQKPENRAKAGFSFGPIPVVQLAGLLIKRNIRKGLNTSGF